MRTPGPGDLEELSTRLGGAGVLLEADWVLPISSPPIRAGAVRLDGATIAEVGLASDLRAFHPGEERRELRGCALLPGLINAHTHLEYSAFRGFARQSGFGEWMLRLLLARRRLAPEDYGISALWGARECVRGGVTYIGDTSFEGWTTGRAAVAAGLRARVYLEVFGLDDARLPQTMERLEARLGALRHEGGPRTEWGVSPHAPYTVSARLYREVARFAKREGLRVATHVAESKAEVDFLGAGSGPLAKAYKAAKMWKGERWAPPGIRPVEYLASAHALGPGLLAVHCVEVDSADIALLAEHRVAIAHCPRSNLRLECGVAPTAEFLEAGLDVGLGTDSAASNDSLDIFAEMRAALTLSRARAAGADEVGPADSAESAVERPRAGAAPRATNGPATPPKATGTPATAPPLTADQVLLMATLGGARALGVERELGSLEPGKAADVIAVSLARPGQSAPGQIDPREAWPGHVGPANVGPGDVDPRHVDPSQTAATDGRTGAGIGPVERLVTRATAADVRLVVIGGQVCFDARSAAAGREDELDRAFLTVRGKLGLTG